MSTPVAIRGAKTLQNADLKSHLAALCEIPRLGLLLGSGASCCAGGKVMSDVWKAVKANDTTLKWLQASRFLTDGSTPNIEDLLSRVEQAIAESERRGEKAVKERNFRDSIAREVLQAALLDEGMWSNPNSDAAESALRSHGLMLQRLIGARQSDQDPPELFTTNYDIAIELAAEAQAVYVSNGFQGFFNRKFFPHSFPLAPYNRAARGKARFGSRSIILCKLHGSLTWQLDESGSPREQSLESAYSQIKGFIDGKTPSLPDQLLIYPSRSKYADTQMYVLAEMFRRFTEFALSPGSALVVVGYSFGDNHVNRVINSLYRSGINQLVIYSPETVLNENSEAQSSVPFIADLLRDRSPRVTIVCGTPRAYFQSFAEDLPESIDEWRTERKDLPGSEPAVATPAPPASPVSAAAAPARPSTPAVAPPAPPPPDNT